MTEQREPLACGHEYTGQARCGGCDKCWTCCQCKRERPSEIIQSIQAGIDAVAAIVETETEPVKPDGTAAVIVASTRQHGKVKDIVVCTCGGRNQFYRWSWAGHGKAKCQHCKSWIDYRTCEVTKPGK